jgi:hypothetical protein
MLHVRFPEWFPTNPSRLLGAREERPHCRAAEERDELAPLDARQTGSFESRGNGKAMRRRAGVEVAPSLPPVLDRRIAHDRVANSLLHCAISAVLTARFRSARGQLLRSRTSQGASAAPQHADDRRIKPVISSVPKAEVAVSICFSFRSYEN